MPAAAKSAAKSAVNSTERHAELLPDTELLEAELHEAELIAARDLKSDVPGQVRHRRAPARRDALRETSRDTQTLSPDEDVLIFRHVMAQKSEPLSMDEVTVEAARRRRRARAPHRPFRLTGAQMLIGGTLLVQLTLVLWLQSQALSLRNRDHKLREKIAMTHQQIAQTQNSIAQAAADTNLEQMAAQMNWRKADVTSFDDVTNTQPLTPQEIAVIHAVPGTEPQIETPQNAANNPAPVASSHEER